jgi:uncharacterized membrane protein HdeD (DUF308 family)
VIAYTLLLPNLFDSKSRWSSIGLGVLVLIFAGIAMSYPVAAAITIIMFIAILINGIARIVQGFRGKHSGIVRAFLIGVGIMAVALSVAVIASPIFGARLAGLIIGIGLLITGNQMVFAGVKGRHMQSYGSQITR